MIKIIVNPTAGGGRAVDHASTVARACADAGMSVHVHVASNRDDTVRTAMETAPRGLVIACGGDGTVHDCLQGVIRADVATPRLAILPVGTGNDIDRGLRLTIPEANVTAADAEGQGQTLEKSSEVFAGAVADERYRAVDVGSVQCGDGEPHYFLGVLSCGFDSDVNERANAMPSRVGKARYLLGVARELPTFRPRWYSIDSDGDDRSMAGMVLAIGNGPAYGSGMLVCPAADMADGLLDVTLVTNAPKRTFVSVLPRVYSGRHIDHPSVTSWTAARLRIDAPDSIVYADGERIGPLPAIVAISHRALEVLDVYHA
ncbi:MAG: diacylglycerol kinase family lipid kinase [Actinomycetales bacterium]|nr:diacylglycerol kinase family lipid kinase [Actinomycetales bacterium]MCP4892932.1 diacylglycerol kinase family lipid kinase [Actinomycetales bacterium]